MKNCVIDHTRVAPRGPATMPRSGLGVSMETQALPFLCCRKNQMNNNLYPSNFQFNAWQTPRVQDEILFKA